MSNEKPKWTPGPWRFGYSQKRTKIRDNVVFVDNDKTTICKCDGDKAHENARLICAAPDLYEALKELLRVHEDRSNSSFIARAAAHQQAEQALAKAEGRG
jgi:hypothetical protein